MAQANAGPVMVPDAVDLSLDPAADGTHSRTDSKASHPTTAHHDDDADEGDAWDSASLLEELLEEETYEYNANGEHSSPLHF